MKDKSHRDVGLLGVIYMLIPLADVVGDDREVADAMILAIFEMHFDRL